jgi:GNAT superfamily N-acetyltransferase
MGEVFVDDLDAPQTGVLAVPDFKIHILGGDTQSPEVKAYLENLPIFSFLLFGSEGWEQVLDKLHPGRWVVLSRYAFSSESLRIGHLSQFKERLPEEYRIKKIDLALAQRIKAEKNEVTEEQLFGFDSAEDFMERGIGYCILLGDEIVSIGAAGAACSKGIEIQINTRKKYERRGLASAVAAALIIDCLENAIDPNWDAATEVSAGLAQKLGYTLIQEYPIYAYMRFKFLVRLRNVLRRLRGKSI